MEPPIVRTTNYGLKSLKYTGACLWNDIPLSIRTILSRIQFTKKLAEASATSKAEELRENKKMPTPASFVGPLLPMQARIPGLNRQNNSTSDRLIELNEASPTYDEIGTITYGGGENTEVKNPTNFF